MSSVDVSRCLVDVGVFIGEYGIGAGKGSLVGVSGSNGAFEGVCGNGVSRAMPGRVSEIVP